MKRVTIGDFKRNLSTLLEEVARGESIILQKGRRRTEVAILSPYSEQAGENRKLGLLADRGKPRFKNWDMTEDDLLDDS